MITRAEYMKNASELHHAYYSQFVTDGVLTIVRRSIGLERIKNSTDGHFNDIPLGIWDRMHPLIQSLCYEKVKACDDYYSLSTSVCIAKAAAKMIKEGAK